MKAPCMGVRARAARSWLAPLLVAAILPAWAQPSDRGAFELARVTLEGDKQVLATVPDTVFAPRVSPDGTEVAFELVDFTAQTAQLTVASLEDLDERHTLPLFGGSMNWAALWGAEGRRIVFLASTPEGDRIWWQAADGSGDGVHLVDGRSAESWASPSSLTYLTLRGDGDYGIHVLRLDARESHELIDLPGSAEHSSNVSRDGRYVAYASDASGRFEVYVEPLPQTGQRTQITTAGGGHPIWAPDGRAMYFDRDGRMYRIGFEPETGQTTGPAEALPIEGFVQGLYRRQFDLLPAGSAFLMLFPAGD